MYSNNNLTLKQILPQPYGELHVLLNITQYNDTFKIKRKLTN